MNTSRAFAIMGFLLLILTVIYGVERVGASPGLTIRQDNGRQVTITDAAGRVHKVMLMHMDQKERKAAAKRLIPRLKEKGVRKDKGGAR
jgi:hypothetical protein